jgi:osmotically-inducible protein OsmY
MLDRISKSAQGRLRGSSYSALRGLDCIHQDGVLTLRGLLPTYYLKQIAQASVSDIAGVRTVANHIEVMTQRPHGTVERGLSGP